MKNEDLMIDKTEAGLKRLLDKISKDKKSFLTDKERNQYAPTITYNIAKSNKNDSDTLFSYAEKGNNSIVIGNPAYVQDRYPHRQKEILQKLKKIKEIKTAKSYQTCFRAILYCEGIREKDESEYHYYDKRHGIKVHCYSESFLQFVIEKMKDREYMDEAIKKWKSRKSSATKKPSPQDK